MQSVRSHTSPACARMHAAGSLRIMAADPYLPARHPTLSLRMCTRFARACVRLALLPASGGGPSGCCSTAQCAQRTAHATRFLRTERRRHAVTASLRPHLSGGMARARCVSIIAALVRRQPVRGAAGLRPSLLLGRLDFASSVAWLGGVADEMEERLQRGVPRRLPLTRDRSLGARIGRAAARGTDVVVAASKAVVAGLLESLNLRRRAGACLLHTRGAAL